VIPKPFRYSATCSAFNALESRICASIDPAPILRLAEDPDVLTYENEGPANHPVGVAVQNNPIHLIHCIASTLARYVSVFFAIASVFAGELGRESSCS